MQIWTIPVSFELFRALDLRSWISSSVSCACEAAAATGHLSRQKVNHLIAERELAGESISVEEARQRLHALAQAAAKAAAVEEREQSRKRERSREQARESYERKKG
jgi:hypothetical protein